MNMKDQRDDHMRAGQLSCLCPPLQDEAAITDNRLILAAGYGLAILAQALVLTILPEQSRLLAPSLTLIGLPFALMMIGAAVATVPAALLLDAFGRQAAFGLGASLGAAGGALSAFALLHMNFFALCVGAFWLGLAQGFALFYRNIAAQASLQAGLVVFSGGIAAAVLTPAFFVLTINAGKIFLIAAGLHIGALALSSRLPHMRAIATACAQPAEFNWRFFMATGAGALAWLMMAATMLHGPLTLARCSATPVFIGGAMSGHLLAMYGPAALAARWPRFFPTLPALLCGCVLLCLGAIGVFLNNLIIPVTLGMIIIGIGWSIVNVASLGLLNEAVRPSRLMLAIHDLTLLSAATIGALLPAS